MTRLLVTGASGFIGAHCLRRTLDGSYEAVHAVNTRGEISAADRVTWHAADLRRSAEALRLIDEIRPTHLLHAAWVATPGIYIGSPENIDWLQASITLVRAFAEQGGKRFVGIGTSAEYYSSDGPCEEDTTPLRPATIYGKSKLALWDAVQAVAQTHKMSAAWGRLFLPYGPGDSPARLIPLTIAALRARRALPLSHGEQQRDFVYAPDAAKLLMRLLGSSVSGAFNIGTGEARSVRSVLDMIADRLGARDCLQFGALPLREGEPPVLVASMRKFHNQLGPFAATPIAQAIDNLLTEPRAS